MSNGNQLIRFKKGAFFSLRNMKIYILDYRRNQFNCMFDNYGLLFSSLLIMCHFKTNMSALEIDCVGPDDFA